MTDHTYTDRTIDHITGNQHAMARALARAHHEEPERSLAGTVSAPAPITGDQDYSGENTDG